MTANRTNEEYQGFEQGPIRPPNEAQSLLIRVTRNCPWNRCTFCPVYKGTRFSIRPSSHVKQDIDAVARHLAALTEPGEPAGAPTRERIQEYASGLPATERAPLQAALSWSARGMRSVFLQDADSLVVRPSEMKDILLHLESRFPWVERTTSYARSKTIDRLKADELTELAAAGLNRVHVGMESASDEVLRRVQKGASKEQHIRAGRLVKEAGIELSEYVMPGLGGRELSRAHAVETARALNEIDPRFIRLRTLAVPASAPLHRDLQEGRFVKLSDEEVAEELLLFLDTLNGISSQVKSDHILNLFAEIDGELPRDKPRMMGVISRFIDMPAEERVIYKVGRRLGLFGRLDDLAVSDARARAEAVVRDYGVTPSNVDDLIDQMMTRFI